MPEEEEDNSPAIVLSGNLVDGFVAYGPFPTMNAAIEWDEEASRKSYETPGIFMPLENPVSPSMHPDDLWMRNDVQFPRLLAEIVATQTNFDMKALADSMDLGISDVNEIFDRAQAEWERIQKLTCPPPDKKGGRRG